MGVGLVCVVWYIGIITNIVSGVVWYIGIITNIVSCVLVWFMSDILVLFLIVLVCVVDNTNQTNTPETILVIIPIYQKTQTKPTHLKQY
jgi:hypothetical protein